MESNASSANDVPRVDDRSFVDLNPNHPIGVRFSKGLSGDIAWASSVTPLVIGKAAKPPGAKRPDGAPLADRPFFNDEQNSRLSIDLPTGVWREKVERANDPKFALKR